jgi:signal transduction histidine kinase
MSALKSAAAVYESPQVRSILDTTQAACVFGLIVFAATVAQVLAPPLLVLLDGGVWTLAVPPQIALPLLVAACAGQALLLMLFDRAPRVSVLGITAIHLLAAVGLGVPSWLSGMYLVIAASLFLLATRVPLAAALRWLTGVVLVIVTVLLWWSTTRGADALATTWWISIEGARLAAPASAAVALGYWWSAKVRRVRRIREETEQARAEHESRVLAAQTKERLRIANDLHDVAGQHLAGLVTLVDAAIKIAPERPGAALDLLVDVRDEGRFAAASLAGALADLRVESPRVRAAIEDLREVDRLADYWRAHGVRVDVVRDAEVEDLPVVVSATAYRCIQESLTNAAKHAPGSEVHVEITTCDSALDVVVVNSAPPTSEPLPGLGLGWGLKSIRESVQRLHGVLQTRSLADGGWEVRFRAPLTSSARPGVHA